MKFLRNPLHWLLLFLPVSLALEGAHAPAAWVFAASSLALVPLAGLLVHATEQLAERAGPAVGGLLNAAFGNAPELIIALVALRAGQVALVKASIVGGLLANTLFVLGLSFLAGGLRFREQEFNAGAARNQCTLLMIAALALIVPSLFHDAITPGTLALEQRLNVTVAIVLLAAYVLSLVFMLKTHPKFFASRNRPPKDGHAAGPGWSRGAALAVLVGASVGLAFASETLVGSVEETAKSLGLSKAFIGIILLSVIGGSAECYAAVSMAAKNQLDLTMGIAVGSGLQIAMFIAPALVLCSQAIGPQPMNLVVGTAGAFVIFLSVLVTMLVAGDGKAHWFKGVLLLCAYGLIALFCYYLPDDLSAARQR